MKSVNAYDLSITIDKRIYRLLSALVFLQAFAFYLELPLWLTFYSGLIVLYMVLFAKPMNSLLRVAFTLLSVGIFVLYFKISFTVEMAASFLFLSASLKLLELRSTRDVYMFIFTMLYLSAVSFLFNQSFLHTGLQVIVLILSFTTLLFINGGTRYGSAAMHMKTMGKLFLFAVPFVIVCFLFFPRIAPFWVIPIKTQDTAQTGISETMAPGDFARLGESTKRAFRAEFSGDIPDKKDLYWRGVVLDYFDGREWRVALSNRTEAPPGKIDLGRFYETEGESYEVMLEPHNKRWVFALEGSEVASSNVFQLDMGLYRLKTDAIQPTNFKFGYDSNVNSAAYNALPSASKLYGKLRTKSAKSLDLQIPYGSNPKTREFIGQLRQRFGSDLELIRHLMEMFSRNKYFYTLEPPTLGANFVDEFIFESKQGFCSHYAGSLAYMLRLAGIPARVVVGYQGGEINRNAGYLIVHQYDAHAWVEADIPSQGWVRLDPTAMVAPDRILHSLGDALEEGAFLRDNPLAAAAMNIGVLNWMRLRMDELNYKWQKMVVNFGSEDQESMMRSWFGEYSLSRLLWIFVGTLLTVAFAVFFYILLQSRRKHYSPHQRKYLRWIKLISRFGYERMPGESPRRFLDRIERDGRHPKLINLTRNITQQFEQSEYQLVAINEVDQKKTSRKK